MTQTNAEFFADIASKIDTLQRLVELRRAQAKTYADADARDWKASTRQMDAALLVESNLRRAAVRARWVAAGMRGAIVAMLCMASVVTHAAAITDISVGGSLTATCGLMLGSPPSTVSQAGVSAVSFGIGDCPSGAPDSISATPTAFVGIFGDVWGAYAVASGSSQLSVDIPADSFGYVEVDFTGTSYGLADPSGTTGDFSGSLDFGLGSVPIFADRGFDYSETISGTFQSADFLTGTAPAGYIVESSWELVAASTEAFEAGWSYAYTATFVDPPETFVATPDATPEPGTGLLAILGLAAFAIRKRSKG